MSETKADNIGNGPVSSSVKESKEKEILADSEGNLGVEETDRGVLEAPQLHEDIKHIPCSEEGEPQEITWDISGRKRKEKKAKKKLVPIWTLFRFAGKWDILMILVGFIMASASGVALPFNFLLFGDIVNNFVYYSSVVSIADDGSSIHSVALSFSTSVNATCTADLLLNSAEVIERIVGNGSSSFLCDSSNENIFENVIEFACDPEGKLRSEINKYSLYYVALGSGVLVSIFIATIFWNISAYRQTRRMRRAFYHSIIHQEIGWFDVNEANELSTRLADDIEKIQSGIGDKVSLFLSYFTTFITGFVIAFTVSWKIALVVSVMLPVLTFIAGSTAKIIATFTAREQKAYATAGAVAEEVLSSIRTVVAFGGESHEAERYNMQLRQARLEGIKKGFFSSIVVGLLYFVIFSTYALGFWYGSTRVIACEISAGDVVTAFFSVVVASFYLGNALPELETFGTALGAATVVFDVIDRKSVIDTSSEEGEVPDSFMGNIKFRDVIFHYPARPKVKVLKGLDLEIKHGQTVALVGASGCGKSTVIQLIQRFYNPDAGEITIDGHKIQDLNLKWLRRNIGVVSQEPVLFDATIEENIRYGREDTTMEEIQEAAKKANAHEFISKLPDGYNTNVGERGAQLSGGQKQRIAIARALVRDPKVLLLDEATSALDTNSEKIVQDALDKAREGRTTVVIAHRLSTIQNADIIIAIENGRVVEMGSHLELMDREGLYFDLVTAQTMIEEEEDSANDETFAGFKAAVRKMISSTSGARPSYSKQESHDSHRSFTRMDSHVSDLRDDPSNYISLEDIPVAASPSLYPGRHAFLGTEGAEVTDADDLSVKNAVENTEDIELGEDTNEGERMGRRRSTLRQLIWRRGKYSEPSQKQKDIPFIKLLKLNLPDWPLVLTGVLMSAVIGALFPLMSILFSEMLRILGLSDPDQIEREVRIIAIGFIGLAVFSGITYFTANFTLSIAGEKLTKRLRFQSFQSILKQEIGWFDLKTNSTGHLTTRLATDAAEVKGATGIRLGTMLQTIVGLITAIVIAFIASWELTFIMLPAFPIMGTVAFFQVRLLAGRTKKNKKRLEESGKTAVESISNVRTVVGLGLEEKFFERYNGLLDGPYKDNIKSVFLQAVIVSISQSLIFYLYSAGFNFGAFLVIEDRLTYDRLFRVFAAVVFTALSLGRASSFAPDAAKAKISAARILSLLNRRPLIDSTNPEGQKMDKTNGDITVKSVHFNYPTRPEDKILQGIDLSVAPGQTLALVGPSGCGKSTVVSLIERFYDPALGSLTLEDTDLRDFNIKWLRSQIGIVSQEPVLFDCSIAENIRYGALFTEVSDNEIIEAAKSANIHSFIESLPEGYNTNVGSKGTQLSGGQKQRIAIARALIRDPKVLLLDEATSALDTESEKVVQEALDKARVGRTTVVIAHRLSTIYNSDVIAVIHNGQVLESGTHSELMALGGAYYHLNTVQQEIEDLN